MRLFVAAYPPPVAVEHLAAFVARLHTVRMGARVARTDTWHVTLAFLGEVPDGRVPDVERAVSLGAGIRRDPVHLWVAGGGVFGQGRSTVLWAGLAGAVAELSEYAAAVRRALGRSRLPYDRKPLRPHLTLGRPGERVPAELLAADVATLADYRGPQWTVERLVLVSSESGPVPRYHPIHAAALSTVDGA